jgi:hypothetical protein
MLEFLTDRLMHKHLDTSIDSCTATQIRGCLHGLNWIWHIYRFLHSHSNPWMSPWIELDLAQPLNSVDVSIDSTQTLKSVDVSMDLAQPLTSVDVSMDFEVK